MFKKATQQGRRPRGARGVLRLSTLSEQATKSGLLNDKPTQLMGFYNTRLGERLKAVLQRVRHASVEIHGQVVARIDHGLVVLLGVARTDDESDVRFIVEKLPILRIFSDEAGKMNQSVEEVGGALLVVSQFTLLADTSRGRRPGFEEAAPAEKANSLYLSVINHLKARGLRVETGVFGEFMAISLQNDGPVTIILDSQRARKVKDG